MNTQPRRSALICLAIAGVCGVPGCTEKADPADTESIDSGVQTPDAATSFEPGLPGRRGISSDWLHHTLSFVDLDKLSAGAKRSTAQTSALDLSAHAAGPINVEVTPDAKLALVSLSAGFFSIPVSGILINAGAIPSDPGALLFLDLEKREIVGQLDTGMGPMGIALTPDGKRAFVAHFSSEHVAVVDVQTKTVLERVTVGQFSEEIALDDTGTVGIVSYSAAGNIRTFASADMAGTLSPPVELTGDAAGVAFFPGTRKAYVVQAPMPLLGAQGGHTLVDVSDPHAPKVLEDVHDANAPVAYPAVAMPKRGSIAVPITADSKLWLQEIKLDSAGATQVVQKIELGPASALLGAYGAVRAGDDTVLLSVPSDHKLISVDLGNQAHFDVPWEISEAGPMDVAVF
jgi:YVTN family beta-propeller protein